MLSVTKEDLNITVTNPNDPLGISFDINHLIYCRISRTSYELEGLVKGKSTNIKIYNFKNKCCRTRFTRRNSIDSINQYIDDHFLEVHYFIWGKR